MVTVMRIVRIKPILGGGRDFARPDGTGGSGVRYPASMAGFSLIEMVVVIIVLGILAGLALRTMTSTVDDLRRVETEAEMEILAAAIVGDPTLRMAGTRADFGYVGDVGAFPPNIQALSQNPGGLATWNGPYLPPGFVQDSAASLIDAWGMPYSYSGGVVITSNGSGSPIVKKITDAASDYLMNRLYGLITDGNDSVPGAVYDDSLEIAITIPDGAGSRLTKVYHPDSAGAFSLDSLPVGTHPLRFIFTPAADTLIRYITILPRHTSSPPARFRFASAFFVSGGGCAGGGSSRLRPVAPGSRTQLSRSGCSANWECVSESIPDGDATRVQSSGGNYKTDSYTIGDPPEITCPISKVTVYGRARKASLLIGGFIKVHVVSGGTEFESPPMVVGDTYADYSYEWSANPVTGLPWIWDEIIDLEAGVSLRTESPAFRVSCTQVWVEVEYVP